MIEKYLTIIHIKKVENLNTLLNNSHKHLFIIKKSITNLLTMIVDYNITIELLQ